MSQTTEKEKKRAIRGNVQCTSETLLYFFFYFFFVFGGKKKCQVVAALNKLVLVTNH